MAQAPFKRVFTERVKNNDMKFELQSPYRPTGDQPTAIRNLIAGIKKGYRDQTLLGVTGSGKTFTMANVVEKLQRPTLVISHNKTLAAQLAAEFREFFPNNAVHYFVSYYDYYQPEAYVPQTDTYIAKDADINEEIDRLRHAATQALLTRRDVLIVASVSCIYGLGSPENYQSVSVAIKKKSSYRLPLLLRRLTDIQYKRNDQNFVRGTFRVRGEILEIFPSYSETAYRVEFFGDQVKQIREIDYLTGEIIQELPEIEIYPAKHFITPKEKLDQAISQIQRDLKKRVQCFKKKKKLLEAQRLSERTKYDLEMLCTVGYVSGIENYSRYFDGRSPGEPPSTLLDYFPKDFLLFIDESHMTIPQIQGMYNGDRSRKETLVNFGFRLPSALDNRPLTFDEFKKRVNQTIYVSATPGEHELKKSKQVVEQIVRPTGLIDPEVEVRPAENQIDDLTGEIKKRIEKRQRVLVTTLTKKMAEDLSEYLSELGIKVQYLHSDVATLERVDLLRSLRLGEVDVLVGINLLREGLDLPEVSLVAILDADKEGFLRSATALIQTFGRASRNIEGKVIMYADRVTSAMREAIKETDRRRRKQVVYNKKHNITPRGVKKAVRDILGVLPRYKEARRHRQKEAEKIKNFARQASGEELKQLIEELKEEMDLAARNLEFERAAELRDQIEVLKGQF